MARTCRIFIENTYNHIVARGIRKEPVFRTTDDYRGYLKLLHKYKIRSECLLYGYCLMPNHVHLVLEFPLGLRSMSALMHCVNQSYALRFNIKYEMVGHLWQNRYKNFVIQKDDYVINAISYVEYNPVRAGLVLRLEDWPWSSYRSRVLGAHDIVLDSIARGQI